MTATPAATQPEGTVRTAQLRFARGAGTLWTTGYRGRGEDAVNTVRDMARQLSQSSATRFIEVILTLESEDGHRIFAQSVYSWSKGQGWN